MKDKFMIMVDEVPFEEKPQGKEIGEIQNFFKTKEAIKELTIGEFLELVGNGHTYWPALPKKIEKGTKNDNWLEQQLIAIDVDSSDNNIVTIDETMDKLREKGIKPFGYYESFHNTKEKPKFRVLFMLDEPTQDEDKIEKSIETLIKLTNADEACKNLGRIYFGTNGKIQEVKLLDLDARVSLDSLLSLYNDKDNISSNNSSSENRNDNNTSNLKKLIENFDLLSFIKDDCSNYNDCGNTVSFEPCPIWTSRLL